MCSIFLIWVSTQSQLTQHYNFSFSQKENLACAKRIKKLLVKLFACKKVCVNLVKSRGFLYYPLIVLKEVEIMITAEEVVMSLPMLLNGYPELSSEW